MLVRRALVLLVTRDCHDLRYEQYADRYDGAENCAEPAQEGKRGWFVVNQELDRHD